MTRLYRRLYHLFKALSIFAMILPPLYFICDAYLNSTLVKDKVTLTCTIVMVLILSAITIINKKAMRSKVWILLLGLYLVLDSLIWPVILIGGGQILDELIFEPCKQHYKQLYIINKEIDKR